MDVDGVLNSRETIHRQRANSILGIDPYLVAIFNRIIFATDAKIVLSSTWRLGKETRDEVRQQVMDFIDITPDLHDKPRGEEVKEWLDVQSAKSDFVVVKYAIIDDDSDFLPDQPLFQTTWEKGLTEEIAKKVIEHLNN